MMPHFPRRAMIGIGTAVSVAVVAVVLLCTGGDLAAAVAVLAGPGRTVALVVLAAIVLIGSGIYLAPHVRTAVRAGHRMARGLVRGVRARSIRRRARRSRQARETASATSGRQRLIARLIVSVIVAAVVAVALVAVVLNFDHGMDVAKENGAVDWSKWLYPVPADGLLISASLVLVWQLLVSGATTWRPRIAFAAGIVASAGTNVLAALHAENLHGADLIERIVWTAWPTACLLLAHEMLLMFLVHYAHAADVFGRIGPSPEVVAATTRAEAAEARAAAAEQHAAARVAQVLQDADRQVAELHSELERVQAQAAADGERLNTEHQEQQAAAQQRVAELHTQLDRQRDAAAAATATVRQLTAELNELQAAEADIEPSQADYEAIRKSATEMVTRLRVEDPHGSLIAVLARRFRVGTRWLQMNVPNGKEQHGQDPAHTRPELSFAS